jgi:hypothetical protein
MSALTERLAASKAKSQPVMYSASGAMWQESALARIDFKGSAAHLSIGRLVTAINNNMISVECADREFVSLLSN